MRDGKGGCCQDAGAEGFCQATSPQRLSHCAHPTSEERVGHRLIRVVAQDVSLCESDGQTAMVFAYLHTVHTVTDRFLMDSQDSGQRRIRDKNSYIFVHTVRDVKVDTFLFWVPE